MLMSKNVNNDVSKDSPILAEQNVSSYMAYFSSFGSVGVAKTTWVQEICVRIQHYLICFYLKVGRFTLNCRKYEKALKIFHFLYDLILD